MAATQTWTHETVSANGLSVHYVAAGSGPLVVLLHGFPEHWYSWHEQLAPLAEAGYRVVAPDLRGYNRTERPSGVEQYRIERLVEDVCGLVDALGHDSATLVGHDWGSIVGWETAIREPATVDALAALGMTHPALFERALDDPRQLAAAWYMFVFRLPWLPERFFARAENVFESQFRDNAVVDDALTSSEFDRYREANARPGAPTAMLNYYRANLGRKPVRKLLFPRLGRDVSTTRLATDRVTVPTLVLWGDEEFFGPSMVDGVEQLGADVTLERFPDAGHWVQLERPDRTTERLLSFLAAKGPRAGREGVA